MQKQTMTCKNSLSSLRHGNHNGGLHILPFLFDCKNSIISLNNVLNRRQAVTMGFIVRFGAPYAAVLCPQPVRAGILYGNHKLLFFLDDLGLDTLYRRMFRCRFHGVIQQVSQQDDDLLFVQDYIL